MKYLPLSSLCENFPIIFKSLQKEIEIELNYEMIIICILYSNDLPVILAFVLLWRFTNLFGFIQLVRLLIMNNMFFKRENQ